jgi:hypothetical protein
VFCCSCASAVGEGGLKRHRRFLNECHVLRMRPACVIPVAMLWVYMQHSASSEIARAMSAKMPSAVTVLLLAVLLALCDYGRLIEIGYTL